jgi:hypothetical protein
MKLADVKRRVEAVLANRGDPEKAHAMDDDLRAEFIRAVAIGNLSPHHIAKCARELMRTDSEAEGIRRWYA